MPSNINSKTICPKEFIATFNHFIYPGIILDFPMTLLHMMMDCMYYEQYNLFKDHFMQPIDDKQIYILKYQKLVTYTTILIIHSIQNIMITMN